MQPFALPRGPSRRVRHIAIRSHFHNPRATLAPVNPFARVDWSRVGLLAVLGFSCVMLVACGVLS